MSAESRTPSVPQRCGATIEGERVARWVVTRRSRCRNFPLKGYDHCRYHLTSAEYLRWQEQRS